MSLVVECEQKSQISAQKPTISEAKIIVDTINAYFQFFDGVMDARLLWNHDEHVRFRVNWWDRQDCKVIKSSFVVLKRQNDEWIVEYTS